MWRFMKVPLAILHWQRQPRSVGVLGPPSDRLSSEPLVFFCVTPFSCSCRASGSNLLIALRCKFAIR